MSRYKWWKHQKNKPRFKQEILGEWIQPPQPPQPERYSNTIGDLFTRINTRLAMQEIQFTLENQLQFIEPSAPIGMIQERIRDTLMSYARRGVIEPENIVVNANQEGNQINIEMVLPTQIEAVTLDIQLE